jgi:glycosyltransferase involved in cell wall biosynthesis
MSIAPMCLALGAVRTVSGLMRSGFDFDVIDAHYYYPDGVAATILGRWFGKPVVVTARGTDVNVLPRFTIPRRLIRWTARNAAASIGVSRALTEGLAALGAPKERLFTLRNGVDLQRFRPLPKAECRTALGLPTGVPLILTVGHLVELKGNHIVIDAVAKLHAEGLAVTLVIVGEGYERQRLEAQAAALGLGSAVRFAGAIANAELVRWYGSADALVLASSREGWPNVLTESLASGTPVIASKIPSTPEIVRDSVAGILFEPREPVALAQAIRSILARPADPAAVRAYAEQFGWDAVSHAQSQLFESVIATATESWREAA